MIQSVQSGFYARPIQAEQSSSAGDKVSGMTASGDRVSFSPEGLAAGMFASMGIEYIPGQSISLDDMEEGLGQMKAELTDKINILFLQNDISTNPPVELTTDSEGKVRVVGDHPDKEKIERLIAGKPGLANDFRAVSALGSLVEAAKEHVEFSKAYAEDPIAAVARFGHLFSDKGKEEFSLVIGLEEEAA